MHGIDVNLTSHAMRRINERSVLTLRAVEKILIKGYDVALGIRGKGRKKKMGRLFYSDKDNEFYVAIQDTDNGDILTIMDLFVAQANGWMVTSGAKDIALEKAFGKDKPIDVEAIMKKPLIQREEIKSEPEQLVSIIAFFQGIIPEKPDRIHKIELIRIGLDRYRTAWQTKGFFRSRLDEVVRSHFDWIDGRDINIKDHLLFVCVAKSMRHAKEGDFIDKLSGEFFFRK